MTLIYGSLSDQLYSSRSRPVQHWLIVRDVMEVKNDV